MLLWLVTKDGNVQRADELLSQGANPVATHKKMIFSETKDTALMVSIQNVDDGLLLLMLSSRWCNSTTHINNRLFGGLEATNIDGNTALHFAVKRPRQLIANGQVFIYVYFA